MKEIIVEDEVTQDVVEMIRIEDLDEIRIVDEDAQVDLADLIEAAEDDLDRLVVQPISPIDVGRIQEIVRLLIASCEVVIDHPELDGRLVWDGREWAASSK